MPQGRVGSHPGRRVPLQASPDEVEEQRVVAAFEGGLELPGTGGTAGFASPGPAAVENRGAVREGRGRAVTGISSKRKSKTNDDSVPNWVI